METTDETLIVVAPKRAAALRWMLVGVVAGGLSLFVMLGTRMPPVVGIGLFSAAVVLTSLVGLQVVAPSLWTITLTPTRVHGAVAGIRFDAALADYRAADVSRRFGEPRLVLRGRRKVILVLPMGADVAALEQALGHVVM